MHRIKQHILAIFKDSHDNVVIGQRPNVLLFLWAILVAIRFFVPGPGTFHEVLSWATLFVGLAWSASELFWGVNTFRRLLGGLIMTILLSRFFI